MTNGITVCLSFKRVYMIFDQYAHAWSAVTVLRRRNFWKTIILQGSVATCFKCNDVIKLCCKLFAGSNIEKSVKPINIW